MSTFKQRLKETILSTLDEPAPICKKPETPDLKNNKDNKNNAELSSLIKTDPFINSYIHTSRQVLSNSSTRLEKDYSNSKINKNDKNQQLNEKHQTACKKNLNKAADKKNNINCKYNKIYKTIQTMTDTCNYNHSGKNNNMNPIYYPICLSPVREKFDFKGYFLDVSMNKKSVIKSNVFKNYNEDVKIKQLEEKIKQKSNNTLKNNVQLKKENIINENNHNSFDSFCNGFIAKAKSSVKPSFSIVNKYLTERLKLSK